MRQSRPALRPADLLLSDLEFDRVYDARTRELSEQHWSPVRVAARAAELLTQAGATRILDVGAGVGKFCIVGALTSGADFIGVERRANLVEIARRAAITCDASRAMFVHADAETYSFDGFDGIYFYNPFYEHIARFIEPIDDTVTQTRGAFRRVVDRMIAKLAALTPPVAVVTFNGLGGPMPADYEFRGDEPAGTDRLELWTRG